MAFVACPPAPIMAKRVGAGLVMPLDGSAALQVVYFSYKTLLMRIGCSTISFAPLTTEEAFAQIADLGFTVIDLAAVPKFFEHVQLVDPPEGHVDHVAALVEKFGFTVSGLQSVPWVPDA